MACNYPYQWLDPTYQRPVCSNVDPTVNQPSPSHYTKQIQFSAPVSSLSLDANALQQQFIQQMAAKGHTISYFRVTYPDAYTAQIDFDASSPAVLVVVAVVLGILAVLVYLITQLIITVKSALGSGGVALLLLAVLAGAVGLAAVGVGSLVSKGKGLFGGNG